MDGDFNDDDDDNRYNANSYIPRQNISNLYEMDR